MNATASNLVKVSEAHGERADDFQIYHRDADGNLYSTNNGETQEKLSARNWMGWTREAQREAIEAIGAEQDDRDFAAVIASQCGCDWDVLDEREQAAVVAWNEKYDRC